MLSEIELSSLEIRVKRSMARGRWQEGIDLIRRTAASKGVDSDELCRAVIRKAFELDHIRPLLEVSADAE